MSSSGSEEARVLPTSVGRSASLIQIALYFQESSYGRCVGGCMGLRKFTGIESDFVFEPVCLEGQQALIHSN